jgi:hypothetical protein
MYVMPDAELSPKLKAALAEAGAVVYDVTPNGIVQRLP